MRLLLLGVLVSAGLLGCAHRDQGGADSVGGTLEYSTNQPNAVPIERGGRLGGTGPGGSTIGGTGSAPDR